jgi:hypothetical protein
MKRLYARFVLMLIKPALDVADERQRAEGDKWFRERLPVVLASQAAARRTRAFPVDTDRSR